MIENKDDVLDTDQGLRFNDDYCCESKIKDFNKEEFVASQNLTVYGNDIQKIKMFEAIALYYGEVENPENTTLNTFFKAKYAPLNEVLNVTRPTMSKFGLACTQTTGIENGECVVTTLLVHKNGGCIYYPALRAKPIKTDVQGIGATITYLRRFALNAVAGVCGEVDDDGNNASEKGETKPVAKKPLTQREELVAACKAKAAKNRKAVDDILKEYVESGAIKDIPENKINEVIKKIGGVK